jgi:hypothetical protein
MHGQTTDVIDAPTPAGWYRDPSGVAELRYFDGSQWTEHVTIDGRQTTAPMEGGSYGAFTMRRGAQWRSEEEKPLEVVTDRGVLGRFLPMVDGVPGYRFDDADGAVVVRISKPGLKNEVEVRDPAGYLLGTITKVGRLRSRYDVTTVDPPRTATVKVAATSTDDVGEWELQADSAVVARFTRTTSSAADALNFASVEYAAVMLAPLDEQMEQLYLAIPLTIDILDTQAL